MTASKVTERAQLIAMVESHRDWEQSCGLTSGGKLLSAPTTLIVDVLDAVLRALRELERDVDERSREIGEVMQVNERLAKERDAARQRVAELERDRRDTLNSPCVIWRRCPCCKRLHADGLICPGDCSEEAINDARAALDRAREGKR